jgi:hypothetical protein
MAVQRRRHGGLKSAAPWRTNVASLTAGPNGAFGALQPVAVDATNGRRCSMTAVRNSRGDRLTEWKIAIHQLFWKWFYRAIIEQNQEGLP